MLHLTPNQLDLLSRTLAVTEAIWEPMRFFGAPQSSWKSAVLERRDAFERSGVPMVIGGSVAERVAGERDLQRLAEHGLVELFSAGKRNGVRLTDKGDDLIRGMVARQSCAAAHRWIAKITRAVIRCDGGNAGYVLETQLLGRRSYAKIPWEDLVGLELDLLPLLVRGWVDSWSDTQGHVGYRVTETGQVARRPPKPKTAYDPELADRYDTHLADARAAAERWTPERRQLVAIPLSAGMWLDP